MDPSTLTGSEHEKWAVMATYLGQVVANDWAPWKKGFVSEAGTGPEVFPDPHEEDGLPEGWTIWSRFVDYVPGVDMVLAQRTGGEWVIVRHLRTRQESGVSGVALTLPGLYGEKGHYADRVQTPEGARLIEGWVRRMLMRLYDHTDPAEATERMLLAIGGPVRVLPAVFRASTND